MLSILDGRYSSLRHRSTIFIINICLLLTLVLNFGKVGAAEVALSSRKVAVGILDQIHSVNLISLIHLTALIICKCKPLVVSIHLIIGIFFPFRILG